jgi:hypothetical protein
MVPHVTVIGVVPHVTVVGLALHRTVIGLVPHKTIIGVRKPITATESQGHQKCKRETVGETCSFLNYLPTPAVSSINLRPAPGLPLARGRFGTLGPEASALSLDSVSPAMNK